MRPPLARLPIRWRLTILFAAVMALVLAGAGTATVLQFRDAVNEGDPTGVLQQHANAIVADLIRELLIVLPLVLLVAVLAAYTLSGAALRPVEAMRSRAATIDADQPEHHLPVPDTGDEIARLGRTLNAMLTRLHTALTRERQFIADASHELRTPLSLLTTELELALRRPRSHDELTKALHSALDETQRLSRLAEDLLTLSRTDRQQAGPSSTVVELGPVLEAVADRFRPALEHQHRHVTVEAPAGLTALANADHLDRALANLVDNALRHATGDIHLTAARTNGHVEVHVLDHGPGLPNDFLPYAFDRFSRPDTARTRPGSGLGLAITAALINANGGHTQLTNHSDTGADASITLPTPHDQRPHR
ncbi:sensor histidine kinase [Haloechinothrix halophila]|uniref:sensor histidine kinase n=1 Tax=Haloechinothrix halophila TaxID=1069073 RepID=UPI000414DEF1